MRGQTQSKALQQNNLVSLFGWGLLIDILTIKSHIVIKTYPNRGANNIVQPPQNDERNIMGANMNGSAKDIAGRISLEKFSWVIDLSWGI